MSDSSSEVIPPVKVPFYKKRYWLNRRSAYLTRSQRNLRDAYAWSFFIGWVAIEIIFILYVSRKLL